MNLQAIQIPFSLCLLFSLISAGPALAAEPAMDEWSAYLRVMWGLLAVLGLILILYAVFKKRFSLLNPRGSSVIKVLETRPLMPRKSLCLVEVRGKEYLLGLGSDTITLLASPDSSQATSFQEILDHSQPDPQS